MNMTDQQCSLLSHQAATEVVGLDSGSDAFVHEHGNSVYDVVDNQSISDEKSRLDRKVYTKTGKHITELIASFHGFQLSAYNKLYQIKVMEQDMIELKIDFFMAKKYIPRSLRY